MRNLSRRYRIYRALPKLLRRLGCLVAVLILAAVFLFAVNRFSLVLELNGEQQVKLSMDEEYVDPGAQFRLYGTLVLRKGLDLDAEIVREGTVDSGKPGEYAIRYHASWLNWSGQALRTVWVTDSQAPEIRLISDPEHYTNPGEVYEEEGFSAWDNVDGDLTDAVIREERDGIVSYTVTDSSGNISTVRREIIYRDTLAPLLHLAGEATVYLKAGENYVEPGWTAEDNADGDLSGQVVVLGSIETRIPGTYELHYSVSDSSGNTATAVRTVVVEPDPKSQTANPTDKIIYLTFDDGPTAYTAKLLDILDRYNAKATFFVVKNGYVDMIGEIARRGHALGIHSVSHEYRTIYASAEAFFWDLETMQQIIYDESGIKTQLMRFPGGSSNTVSRFNKGIMTHLTNAVQEKGFVYFDWNVDSMDAGGAKTADEVFHNVISGVEGRSVSIVLQHDSHGFSVDAVEKILKWGTENGYTFLPLDTGSPTAHHYVNN